MHRVRNIICRVLYVLIQWTWGILQNVIGVLLMAGLLVARPSRARELRTFHGAVVVPWGQVGGSMGMGMFIFFGHDGRQGADRILVHEYGHTIQSCILGPAYLFVIGLPSLLWAWLPACRNRRAGDPFAYFDFYPERWANYAGTRVTHKPAPARRNDQTNGSFRLS